MERGEGSDASGARISRHVFSSQYQQAPVSLGGNIIRGEYFKRYTVTPKIKWRKIFADTAMKTKEANDYSVFEEWGLGVDGLAYLLDMIRGKWEAPELQRRALAFWAKCKARDINDFGQLRKMVVEDKSSGTGLVQTIKLSPHLIPIEAIERDKDKFTRVMDALPYIECGQVCVPEGAPFTNDFVTECESFTADNSHDFDDQIDPLCDAVHDLLQSGNKLKLWEALGKGDESAKKEIKTNRQTLHAFQSRILRQN
jgi:predicted phage terminase large subunit-like protein